MEKAMISQPMHGKSEEEIKATRLRALQALAARNYAIVNTLFTGEWYSEDRSAEQGVVNRPLMFFAESVEGMSHCHAVYFCKGWESARGCKLEHAVAEAYGLTLIYEEDD